MNTNGFIAIPAEAMERHFSPIYDETMERLLRMGFINTEDRTIRDNVGAFCIPLAATFYDNLIEYGEDALGVYESLVHMYCNEETTGMYLYLCLLYGQMGEIIPEPVQWLSGHSNALFVFCETLIDQMTDYLKEDGLLDENDDDDDDETDNVTPITQDVQKTPLKEV